MTKSESPPGARGIVRVDGFDGDVDVPIGTATVLRGRWLATCAHVITKHWELGDERKKIEQRPAGCGRTFALPGSPIGSGSPARSIRFHRHIDVALVELDEPLAGVGPYPMLRAHESDLRADLLPLPFAATGFPHRDPTPTRYVDLKLTERSGADRGDRATYYLTGGPEAGTSGGPLLAWIDAEWVCLGIAQLGGRGASGAVAWSTDVLASIPDLPDEVRDHLAALPTLRQALADDPQLAAFLRHEIARLDKIPHLMRSGLRHADLDSLYQRRLVRLAPPGMREREVADLAADASTRPCDLRTLLRRANSARQTWLVVGEPGMGKTTLFRHEAWRLSHRLARRLEALVQTRTRLVPLFVRLPQLVRRWIATENAPRDPGVTRLEHALMTMPGTSPHARIAIRRALRPRIALLLDGFDEAIVKKPEREALREVLAAVANEFRGCAVLISSRPAGVVENGTIRTEMLPPGTRIAELQPLGPQERVELVRKLAALKSGKEVAARDVEAWFARALDDPRSEGLSGNPLWLTLQALLFAPKKKSRRGQGGPDEPSAPPATLADLVYDAIAVLLSGEHQELPDGHGTIDQDARDLAHEPLSPAKQDAARALLCFVAERLTALGAEAAPIGELAALWRVWTGKSSRTATEREAQAEIELAPESLFAQPHLDVAALGRRDAATLWPDEDLQVWHELRLKTGLVVQPGADHAVTPSDDDDEPWRFWHRLFQEALAAEALAMRWQHDRQGVLAVLQHEVEEAARRADKSHLIPKGTYNYLLREFRERWPAILDIQRNRMGENWWLNWCGASMARGSGPWIRLDRAIAGEVVEVPEDELPEPSPWGEVVVFFSNRVDDASDLAGLAVSLEEQQLHRFLRQARHVSQTALLQLIASLPADGLRGQVIEAASRFLRGEAEITAFLAGARSHFDEYGAWCWFADELLRSLEQTESWAGQARRSHWSSMPDARSVPVPVGLSGEPWIGVDGGAFWMGSPSGDAQAYNDEHPQHPVTVSSFRMWRTPVTVAQYRVFDPQHQDDWTSDDDVPKSERLTRPVTNVSWWAAMAYSRWAWFWITDRHRLDGTLPSEAEWEFSCRAMRDQPAEKHTRYWFGNDESDLAAHAWYRENSRNRVHAVAHFAANEFGLHDIHGNVWEWCRDHGYVYDRQPGDGSVSDPEGPAVGALRAVRGGGYGGNARGCRSACRGWSLTGVRNGGLGFRPVLPAARARQALEDRSLSSGVNRRPAAGPADPAGSPACNRQSPPQSQPTADRTVRSLPIGIPSLRQE